MTNEIPKGAILSEDGLKEGDKVWRVAAYDTVNDLKPDILRRSHILDDNLFFHPSWLSPDHPTGWAFKNYWDARAYVLKRDHDRSTRDKEVPEQGTG